MFRSYYFVWTDDNSEVNNPVGIMKSEVNKN